MRANLFKRESMRGKKLGRGTVDLYLRGYPTGSMDVRVAILIGHVGVPRAPLKNGVI